MYWKIIAILNFPKDIFFVLQYKLKTMLLLQSLKSSEIRTTNQLKLIINHY